MLPSPTPGSPPGLSALGSLLFARRFVADPRGPIDECTERFGPIWRSLVPAGGSRSGLVPLIWLMGRAGNERILAPTYRDDFTWYDGYCFTMEPLFGRQILLLLDDEPATPGQPRQPHQEAHRQRHRVIVPAFHPRLDPQYLAEIGRILDVHLSEVAATIQRPSEGVLIDLQEVVRRVTFHVVASLVLGAPDADPGMPRSQLLHWFEELGQGLFSVVHLNLPGLPFRRATRARAVLAGYLQGRISAYRRGEGTPPPMLHNLMTAQAEDPALLPDEAIISELISFLYAGYDTTASLLTSVVAALRDEPAIYARLRDTLAQHTPPRDADEDALQAGADGPAYLHAVLYECERLYPPLHFLMRGVRHDLEYGGYHIAAGSKVAYSPYYTGRMAELFPDPLRLRPERHLNDDGTLRRPAPYTLLGFGGGHRMCIGKRLAGLELRMFMTQLLSRFELAWPEGGSPDGLRRRPAKSSDEFYFNPALQRRYGVWARLIPRRLRQSVLTTAAESAA